MFQWLQVVKLWQWFCHLYFSLNPLQYSKYRILPLPSVSSYHTILWLIRNKQNLSPWKTWPFSPWIGLNISGVESCKTITSRVLIHHFIDFIITTWEGLTLLISPSRFLGLIFIVAYWNKLSLNIVHYSSIRIEETLHNLGIVRRNRLCENSSSVGSFFSFLFSLLVTFGLVVLFSWGSF